MEALFAHTLSQGVRPLWRIGVRQKVATILAEKLHMEEIGTTGASFICRPAEGRRRSFGPWFPGGVISV